MKLHGPVQPHLASLMVKDIMCPHSKRWNVNLLHNIFGLETVDAIFRVPLVQSMVDDNLVSWPYAIGTYSVKSAYHIYMSQLVKSRTLHVKGMWDDIWHLHVPRKVIIFYWQLCHDILPICISLQVRGVPCPVSYVMCSMASKTRGMLLSLVQSLFLADRNQVFGHL